MRVVQCNLWLTLWCSKLTVVNTCYHISQTASNYNWAIHHNYRPILRDNCFDLVHKAFPVQKDCFLYDVIKENGVPYTGRMQSFALILRQRPCRSRSWEQQTKLNRGPIRFRGGPGELSQITICRLDYRPLTPRPEVLPCLLSPCDQMSLPDCQPYWTSSRGKSRRTCFCQKTRCSQLKQLPLTRYSIKISRYLLQWCILAPVVCFELWIFWCILLHCQRAQREVWWAQPIWCHPLTDLTPWDLVGCSSLTTEHVSTTVHAPHNQHKSSQTWLVDCW